MKKMTKEDKLLFEDAKKILNISSLKELAKILKYSEGTANNWYSNGFNDKVRFKIKDLIYTPVNSKNTISVTKLSPRVGAGGGVNVESIDSVEKVGELILDLAVFKTTPPTALFAMQVDGYSMIPLLFPDSWVVFDSSIKEYIGEGLYVLNFRNTLMVKLLQINENGHLRIISTNKDYESYTTSLDDQSTFRIFGKVSRSIV